MKETQDSSDDVTQIDSAQRIRRSRIDISADEPGGRDNNRQHLSIRKDERPEFSSMLSVTTEIGAGNNQNSESDRDAVNAESKLFVQRDKESVRSRKSRPLSSPLHPVIFVCKPLEVATKSIENATGLLQVLSDTNNAI